MSFLMPLNHIYDIINNNLWILITNGGFFMNNIIKICIICTLLSFLPSISTAQVSSEYMGDKKQTYSLAYPVVDIEDKKIEDKINEDIEAQLEDLKEKIEKHVYSKVDMTYYEKYEEIPEGAQPKYELALTKIQWRQRWHRLRKNAMLKI